jgi:hypothetical protein
MTRASRAAGGRHATLRGPAAAARRDPPPVGNPRAASCPRAGHRYPPKVEAMTPTPSLVPTVEPGDLHASRRCASRSPWPRLTPRFRHPAQVTMAQIRASGGADRASGPLRLFPLITLRDRRLAVRQEDPLTRNALRKLKGATPKACTVGICTTPTGSCTKEISPLCATSLDDFGSPSEGFALTTSTSEASARCSECRGLRCRRVDLLRRRYVHQLI